MLRYMLDTNLCISVLRDRPKNIRKKFNEEASSLCISTVVLYELLTGARKSARPEHNLLQVESFASRLEVLDYDTRASDHTAEIRNSLEQAGCVIGPYDLMIAGHARSRGLCVVTGNLGEFCRVKGLLCEDWTGLE